MEKWQCTRNPVSVYINALTFDVSSFLGDERWRDRAAKCLHFQKQVVIEEKDAI